MTPLLSPQRLVWWRLGERVGRLGRGSLLLLSVLMAELLVAAFSVALEGRVSGTYLWIGAVAALLGSMGAWPVVNLLGQRLRVAESGLRAATAELCETQEVANMGSWEWDLRTDAVSWSDQMYRIFGITRTEHPDSLAVYLQMVHPEDREVAGTVVERALQRGGRFDYRYRIVRPDGEVRVIQARGRVVSDRDGRFQRIVGTGQDVTERAAEEQALRASERRMRALFEQNPMASLIVARDGTLKAVNRAFERLWQVSGVPSQPYNLLHDAELTAAGVVDALRRGLGGADVELADFHYRWPHGTREALWLRGAVYPIRDRDGSVHELILTYRDVSARRATQQALAESGERLRTLINATPDIICFKDGAGRWLEANEADLELFSLQGVDYRGRRDSELAAYTLPLYRQAFLTCEVGDEHAWEAGTVVRAEEEIPLPNGDSKVYDVIKVPLFNEQDGSRRGLVVLGRDVTERRRVEDRLQLTHSLLERSNDAIFVLAPVTGRILEANATACVILGYSREQLLQMDVHEICCRNAEHDPWEGLLNGEPGQERMVFEGMLRGCEGVSIAVENSASRVEMDGGIYVLAVIRDITERKRDEERLRQWAVVFENTSEGVMISDAEDHIVAVNRAFCQITGYTEHEVLGRSPSLLNSGRHSPEFFGAMRHSISNAGYWQGEVWNRRRNGEIFPEWLSVTAVRDEDERISQYISVFSDLSEVKASEEQLNFLAHHDPLTELPNRLLFISHLGQAMERARRRERRLAVLIIDLDRFKMVNDSMGHPLGDQLLQAVSQRLVQVVRREDMVARLGGDEFTIALESLAASEDASKIANKLVEVLAEPFKLEGQEVYISASVGISLFPDDGNDVTTVLKNADVAMYRAKDLGRNNYQFYTEELTDSARERLHLEAQLRRAIERSELSLHYQPQVDLTSGRLVAAEALLRWHHHEQGMIAPARFIPIAEDSGLIDSIGQWVLREACRQARAWRDAGLPALRLAVNVAAQQFVRGHLVEQVGEALAAYDIAPQFLELEVTESTLMTQLGKAVQVLQQLKGMGVQLAIDDFGTGYSSLNYLKRLPIHRLKIDRSFVRDLPDDAEDEAIAASVIALGHSLKLEVIAEGVETEVQEQVLRGLGCDQVQGYLHGRPMSAEQFAQLLTRDGKA